MPNRRLAVGVLGSGAIVIVVARLLFPAAPPLYDGVVPLEPYMWLDPPPGASGGAQGATAEITVREGGSPLVGVVTPEQQPQAQLFAQPNSFDLAPDVEQLEVTIQPIVSEGAPKEGHIDGNVYRITVTDQDGAPLTAPASAQVTVVLRATDPTLTLATISRFNLGGWQPLKTESTGFGGTFIAVVTEFGDFAVIAPGPGRATVTASVVPSATGGASSVAPAHPSPGTTSPPAGAGSTAVFPGWLLPAIVAVILVLATAGYRLMRLRRRKPHRGAHRVRRR